MLDITGLSAVAASIRGLTIDAVEESGTGHPGMPMGTADIGATLYGEVLRHNPSDPGWLDRDRFVLSAGHGSMLLYSLLHIFGYDLRLEELKQLRRLGSRTPGHPEYGITSGVETTTGPLGAGFATAVGMAIAETRLAAEFNTADQKIIDHRTYVLSGDGCLMEGVSSEAASLAGHLKLGKLIVLYDSNNVSIEGNTDITFTEDVRARFTAYGWQTLAGDGHDPQSIVSAITEAHADTERPSLVVLRTTIGRGSPKMAGSHAVHGATLGGEEIAATKRALGLPENESFVVLPEARRYAEERISAVRSAYEEWLQCFAAWSEAHPDLRTRLDRYLSRNESDLAEVAFPDYQIGAARATRDVNGDVIQALARGIPNFVGGSADLSHSNKTEMPEYPVYSAEERTGRTIRYGVREHAMASIQNGMLLHGGVRSFAATLFVFVDYMRPAMRLAALMGLPAIYVLTHDSVYLGGDGPTHQPIEHLNSLRIIPNMRVLRPGDPNEAVECWKMALERNDGPTCLVLSRQALPVVEKDDREWRAMLRRHGAYVVRRAADEPDATILATGSELTMALDVAAELDGRYRVRVVSVASRELLAEADPSERRRILGDDCPVFAVEAGGRCGWERFTGGDPTRILGIDRFGESGRGDEVAKHLGLTVEALTAMVASVLENAEV